MYSFIIRWIEGEKETYMHLFYYTESWVAGEKVIYAWTMRRVSLKGRKRHICLYYAKRWFEGGERERVTIFS